MDKVSKEKRSNIMRAVKGKGNKSTEKRLRGALSSLGVCGWKMHQKNLPGNPDFAFYSERLAVFVEGCFWHGCTKCYRAPSTQRTYWAEKLRKNQARDLRNGRFLRDLGWSVLRIWEHELSVRPATAARKISAKLVSINSSRRP